MWKKIKAIASNKVMLYLTSRYATYFIQFLTSIFLAVKFGPYYFGIWGFILLLINYINCINFGISNSVNILLVQNKNNVDHEKNIVANSLILIGLLSLLIIILAIYYSIFGIKAFEKYEIGNYFYIICIIGIGFHFNSLFGTIYRVKNRLFELAFFQSIVPILLFLSLFFATGKALLQLLLSMYLIAEVAALIIFIINKKIPWGGKPSIKWSLQVLSKGFYLFIYNMCFFFIIISTRTIISIFYSVEDFGYFTFSYTLANSMLLFLQALSIIIFPKIIDKLYSHNKENIKNILNILNVNYITLSYGLMFLALIGFPIFIYFIPKYQETLKELNLIAITVLLYTNSFGYRAYLMAQNQEKRLSIISLFSLCLNIALGLIIVLLFKATYEYVIIATLVSYFIYSYLLVKFARRKLGEKTIPIYVIFDFFPLRLLIPYILAVVIIIMKLEYLIFIPFLTFLILNRIELKQIITTITTIISRPSIIDIKENEM
jgi:O-antigen/teichoic acid export membrane protein